MSGDTEKRINSRRRGLCSLSNASRCKSWLRHLQSCSGGECATRKARVSGNQMSIPLRAGGAGTYHVNWHVLSVDTHTTEGNFTFQVGQ